MRTPPPAPPRPRPTASSAPATSSQRRASRRGRVAIGGIGLGLVLTCAVGLSIFDRDNAPVDLPGDSISCSIPAVHDPKVTTTIYEAGIYHGVSSKVMLSAFEAGWVESRMQNLSCGDRDSVGVFQQRASQGWGNEEDLRNVRYAAGKYFEHAEAVERDQPHLSAGELAQSVQRSAFPQRYDEAEDQAREMIKEIEQPPLE